MTVLSAQPEHRVSRSMRQRHYLMCAPTYFDVAYAINPWMDPNSPVDADRAYLQWDILRNTYLALGHKVDVIDPEPGLPDMVFAANGGLVVGGHAYTAQFAFPQRGPEGPAYQKWFLSAGLIDVHEAAETNEGEGDFLTLADVILAGTGFRTTIAAHIEAAAALDRPCRRLAQARRPTVLSPGYGTCRARKWLRTGTGRDRLLPGSLQPAQPADTATTVSLCRHRQRGGCLRIRSQCGERRLQRRTPPQRHRHG